MGLYPKFVDNFTSNYAIALKLTELIWQDIGGLQI